MKTAQPMTKVEMIERSLRCFGYGLIALLPVVGLPLAVLAIGQYLRVKRGQGDMWNPAQRYLFWGGLCGRMSLAFYFIIPVVLIVIARLVNY
jgi:hypothetical protein